MERVSLNGVKVYPFTSTDELLAYVSQRKGILVAINAGKIYHATDQLRDLINNNIGYIDGAGALKAVKYKGVKNAIKIPGCELWLNIIERKYKSGCSFYLIGGKQDVIDDTISLLHRQFPGIQIVGYRNGYIKEEEYEPLLMDVASSPYAVILPFPWVESVMAEAGFISFIVTLPSLQFSTFDRNVE